MMRALSQLAVSCLVVAWAVAPRALAAGPASAPDPAAADYQTLRAAQEVFRGTAQRMKPYLVRIDTVGGSQPRGALPLPDSDDAADKPKRSQNPWRESTGSDFVIADGSTTGLIYAADGYIVTSSFNFVREPVLISATLADGRRLAADLVARDQVRKIALLKVDARGLATPPWAPLTEVKIGQWAVALGLGFGGDEPAITTGIISALNRMNGNAVQTDAKLSPANYGGPLCDLQGRVVGICVPMAQRPGELAGVEMYDAGVGFAVPQHRVDEIVRVLMTGKSLYRGWLGMVVDNSVRDAVVVKNVADPSPLRAAGVVPGDTILAAAGKPVYHFGHLTQALYMLPAGEDVALHIDRNGTRFLVNVTLARNTELGPLPELNEPFDPSEPPAPPPEEEGDE